MHKIQAVSSALFLSFLLVLVCFEAEADSFWKLENVNANDQRVNEVENSIDKCTQALDTIFTEKPSELIIITYGTRSSFVKGLQSKLGFPRKKASYFKNNSAPRPLQGKYLIPPDQELKNICHEITHHYLEGNAKRKYLLDAKWFDEGTATYLADHIFESGDLERGELQLKKIPKEKYYPLNYMEKERQWNALHKDQRSRYFAYTQAGLMVEYFFGKFGVSKFQTVLEKMRTAPFKEAFFQAIGITDDQFYKDWIASFKKRP
ncbi:MAG: hypothetical protein Q7T03_03160 [Deltaproteobacteria bacterium]|nr:hypothetical protein [Deltaproteobacteria bacterium]